MQHVGRGRVVQDDSILHVSANLRHIFCENPVDVSAMLPEKTHGAITIRVHEIHERVSILTQTSRKNYQLEVLTHSFQEVVNARSLAHENVADVAFDVYWDGVVWALDLVKLGVHQRFI